MVYTLTHSQLLIGRTEGKERRMKSGLKRHWQLIPSELAIPIQLPKPRNKAAKTKAAKTKANAENGNVDQALPTEQVETSVETEQQSL